jgi:hypothetical protein
MTTGISPVNATQSGGINSRDWTIALAWTNPNQPSGGGTTVDLIVNVTNTAYDLTITVAGQGITVSNNLGSGDSYSWSQLNQGDTRQIEFTLTTPSQAPVGDRYNVTVLAQSYSTPAGPFGVRSPFDSPNKASTSFLLSVTPVQVTNQLQNNSVNWGGLAAASIGGISLVLAGLYLWSRRSW